MKHVKKIILAAIFIVVFSMAAVAGDKNHAIITVYRPTQLGSALLAPGEYDLAWSGTGNDVKVTLSKGKKILVTVPARVSEQRDLYGGGISTEQTENGALKLTGVQLPKLAFTFADTAGSANGQ